MAKIHYLIGDATEPATRPAVIAHICNNIGAWGAGFVVPLGRKYPSVKNIYLHKAKQRLNLGGIITCMVESFQLSVVHMIAQDGIRSAQNPRPIRYDSLKNCLSQLVDQVKISQRCINHEGSADTVTVHMPRIGCGLAGGKWEEVEPLIQETLIASGIDVYVYDLS